MTFGEKLKQLRESRYLTQMKLAIDLGVAQSTIAAYERGQREPSFSVIQKIADYFHVPFISLMPSTSDTVDESYVNVIAESLHQNPKLGLLFDKTKNFSEKDLDAMIVIADTIVRRQE